MDLSESNFDSIIELSSKYSMLSNERFQTNLKSINYIEKNNILGDVVEIGVWKGGSILSMILLYETYKKQDRTFYLYDTFSGMTDPTNLDVDLNNKHAKKILHEPGIKCLAPYDLVKQNIDAYTNYPNIEYVVGDICKNTTYPKNKIALLRLDTDWYESTKVELETFYPRVQSGGIIIIDDYGHWQGCRKAVDQFLLEHTDITVHKSDYTGIWFCKP